MNDAIKKFNPNSGNSNLRHHVSKHEEVKTGFYDVSYKVHLG